MPSRSQKDERSLPKKFYDHTVDVTSRGIERVAGALGRGKRMAEYAAKKAMEPGEPKAPKASERYQNGETDLSAAGVVKRIKSRRERTLYADEE